MDELTILIRAFYLTYEFIEKEEKINERTIRERGRENGVALYRIKKYEEEKRYLYDRIMALENKK